MARAKPRAAPKFTLRAAAGHYASFAEDEAAGPSDGPLPRLVREWLSAMADAGSHAASAAGERAQAAYRSHPPGDRP